MKSLRAPVYRQNDNTIYGYISERINKRDCFPRLFFLQLTQHGTLGLLSLYKSPTGSLTTSQLLSTRIGNKGNAANPILLQREMDKPKVSKGVALREGIGVGARHRVPLSLPCSILAGNLLPFPSPPCFASHCEMLVRPWPPADETKLENGLLVRA